MKESSKKTRLNEKGLIDLIDCSSIGIQNNYQAYISQPKGSQHLCRFRLVYHWHLHHGKAEAISRQAS